MGENSPNLVNLQLDKIRAEGKTSNEQWRVHIIYLQWFIRTCNFLCDPELLRRLQYPSFFRISDEEGVVVEQPWHRIRALSALKIGIFTYVVMYMCVESLTPIK
jgi:hypothetical protein